jgi:hypothetical protein
MRALRSLGYFYFEEEPSPPSAVHDLTYGSILNAPVC